ncbi:MAG: hypothetical protein GY720_23730 [bacterium]|nr:hypothetical protein [bacterium]
MIPVAVAAIGILLASCSGSGVSSSIAASESEPTGPMSVIGINETGMTDLTEEEWADLGRIGCARQAWQHAQATAVAAEFAAARGLPDEVDTEALARTVWILTVTTCRADVPVAVLEIGPP